MDLKRWAQEPLVHFLIAGTLIFLFFAWRGEEADPASRVIDISREDKAQLSVTFERTMGRPPTDTELDRQIDRYIREEVLYREALRLGLDGDDAVVRRRLSKKMDQIASAQAETAMPSDEVLKQWLADYPERFTDDARYTLDQLYFEEMDAAKAQMGALSGETNWRDLGQAISLPPTMEDMPRKEVLDRFGERFLMELDALDSGEQWQGPITSGYGWHLVRLRAKESGEVPSFADVREDVLNDWRRQTINDRKEAAYGILRDAYKVNVAQ